MSNLVICEGCGRECNPDQEQLSHVEVNVLDGPKREITLCDKVCCEFWDEAGPGGWVKLDSGEEVQRIFWQCEVCEGVYRHAVLVMLVDMDDYDPEEGKEPYESVVCLSCRGKERGRFKTRAEVEGKA